MDRCTALPYIGPVQDNRTGTEAGIEGEVKEPADLHVVVQKLSKVLRSRMPYPTTSHANAEVALLSAELEEEEQESADPTNQSCRCLMFSDVHIGDDNKMD